VILLPDREIGILDARICLAKLKQLNHKDHQDRKEKSLRGLCDLRGSNSSSTVLTCARFTNG
jgi:hypothetical protein